MSVDSVNLHIDTQNLEHYLQILCAKLEFIQEMSKNKKYYYKRSINSEVKTVDFWRSVISECLASFFYVLLVCGALTGAGPGVTSSNITIISAFASGLSVVALTQCFGKVSGDYDFYNFQLLFQNAHSKF